jgi:hypothetical protein
VNAAVTFLRSIKKPGLNPVFFYLNLAVKGKSPAAHGGSHAAPTFGNRAPGITDHDEAVIAGPADGHATVGF